MHVKTDAAESARRLLAILLLWKPSVFSFFLPANFFLLRKSNIKFNAASFDQIEFAFENVFLGIIFESKEYFP
jgi:hypothetical protein